jgi:hypothetical protein
MQVRRRLRPPQQLVRCIQGEETVFHVQTAYPQPVRTTLYCGVGLLAQYRHGREWYRILWSVHQIGQSEQQLVCP